MGRSSKSSLARTWKCPRRAPSPSPSSRGIVAGEETRGAGGESGLRPRSERQSPQPEENPCRVQTLEVDNYGQRKNKLDGYMGRSHSEKKVEHTCDVIQAAN